MLTRSVPNKILFCFQSNLTKFLLVSSFCYGIVRAENDLLSSSFFFLDQSVAQFIYADVGDHLGNSPMA